MLYSGSMGKGCMGQLPLLSFPEGAKVGQKCTSLTKIAMIFISCCMVKKIIFPTLN